MSSTVTQQITLPHSGEMFVDGRWVPPEHGGSFAVVDPATEGVLYHAAEAGEADIERAVGAARQAFDSGPWPRMSYTERAGYLRAMADRLSERSAELAGVWTAQVGITRALSTSLMPIVLDTFRYYADLAATYPFLERHDESTRANVGLLVREPVGVVGAIVPWNGPALLIASKAVPALLAGCTVVVKAAPEAPGEAHIFADVAQEVGLPPGVVNVVVAEREASESLVRDPRVDKISFTGSTPAGRRVAGLCGERIARVSLELGGKSPAIILDDYDVGVAAQTIAATTTFLSGQVCAAVTRVIVPDHRHDTFVDALVAALDGVVVGDPTDPATTMGPVSSSRQRDRIEGFIAQGVAEGASLATGGGRPAQLPAGFYLEPTVFADVNNRSTIAQEEIFGPVLCVIRASDEDQSVAIANDSPYGLSSSVFTHNVDRAYSIARRLRCGVVAHNAMRNELGIAFGGFKQSGIARKGGVEGMLPFLETKTITLDGIPDLL
jgi:acyl-CoA reductase-like NAD-dependent aldehyde dehydrogenase